MPSIQQLPNIGKTLYFGKFNENNLKIFSIQSRELDLPKHTKKKIFSLTKKRLNQTLVKENQAKLKPLQIFDPCISIEFADDCKRHSLFVQEQDGDCYLYIKGLLNFLPICLGKLELDDSL